MAAADSHDRSCLDGHEVELFQLVKKGATLEQWREWLRTPLEHAAADGNMDLFTRLMGAGADSSADWRGCHGSTLLGAAAFGKNEKIVSALLEAGEEDDVGAFYGDGTIRTTALHMAATRGAESVSQVLLSAGADPNLLDGNNRSPLNLAAFGPHPGIVGKLLHHGAVPNAANSSYQVTPLHDCLIKDGGLRMNDSSSGRCVSQLLAAGADKDAVTSAAQAPLYLAVVRQHPQAVELLLAAGADTNLVPDGGGTLLLCAAGRKSLSILKLLLQHGCSVNDSNSNGGPPALHHAAEKGETGDNVRALLDAGADIEARTDADRHHYYFDGFSESYLTPLHVSAIGGSSNSTLLALVEGGANVDAQSGYGRTALHIACRLSNVEGVDILLGAGANESLPDRDERTAVDLLGDIWDYDEEEKLAVEIDNQIIRQMVARAPADRAWRRRGWLVLCRSCPTSRAWLADAGGNRARSATESGAGGEAVGGATWDDVDEDLAELVAALVALENEGISRLVVGFL